MIPAQSRIDAGIWSVPGVVPVIEYSRTVLNEILVQVVEAYRAYLDGGFEVGGALFGQRQGDHIRILAFRPIPITPPRPTFVLSKQDSQQVDELLKGARQDPDLKNMIPVGWYHSHTRSEIFLSQGDVEIYDRHFPEPWQIAMVLRPSEFEPVRVGFFFRESDGFIRTGQSYKEFAVEAPAPSDGIRRPPPWEPSDDGPIHAELADVPPVEADIYALPPEQKTSPLWKRFARGAMVAGVLSILAAGAYSLVLLRQPEATMRLRINPSEGELIILWDPTSPLLEDASEATLSIVDGKNRVEIPINSRKLSDPRYNYKPLTGRVDVRLLVKQAWGRTRQDVATWLVHPELGKPSPELLEARRLELEAEQQVRDLKSELLLQSESADGIQNRVDFMNQELQQLAESSRKQSEAKRQALLPAKAIPTAARELPNAPEIATRGVATPGPPVGNFGVDPRMRPPSDPPRPAPIPPSGTGRAAVPPGPAAVLAPVVPVPKPPLAHAGWGRIIWTGTLARDGQLTIDGRTSTLGAVNAELPGVPVRIGAYPAELTNTGLRVLTSNPKYISGKSEPPSASNGYTETQYLYDLKSVRDLIVVEMPQPQAPRRIVLRAGGRRLSAIVIEWQVIPQ